MQSSVKSQPSVQSPTSLQQQSASPQQIPGHPPGTVMQRATAQVIQTSQGPRIVLQGLQGTDLTPQQLAAVQQQVKQQLLKGKLFFLILHTFS